MNPPLHYERALSKHEASHFGISDDFYQKTFWGLRPDFFAESDGSVLILEAKGGQPSDGVWKNPKELVYDRFLRACTKAKTKGFLYIVPLKAARRCAQCLRDQFPVDTSIRRGVVVWEQLLPLMSERLVETVLDQVIREMEGIRQLRRWQKSKLTGERAEPDLN